MYKVFFLEGIKAKKKIAYAPSIANEGCVSKYKKDYKKLIKKLDYISVREEKAKKELEKISDKDIKVVADPTLLLTKEEWEKTILDKPVNKKLHIFLLYWNYDKEGEEMFRYYMCKIQSEKNYFF